MAAVANQTCAAATFDPEERMETSLPFTPAEFRERLSRVRTEMAAQSLDLLILNAPENIYYLTGHETKGVFANQYLAVPRDGPVLFMTRRIEVGNVARVVNGGSPIDDYALYGDTDDPLDVFVGLLRRHNLGRGRIGVETHSWYLLVDHYERLKAALTAGTFVDAGAVVEAQRLIKSPAELEYHRRAGRIAVQAMRAGVAAVRPGESDGAVITAALAAMIEAGGEWSAAWPNVAAGRRTSLGHATWANVPIAPGETVLIELAGVVRRYHTPLWRSILVGPIEPEQRRLALAIRDANEAGLESLRAGVTVGDVHETIRSVLNRSGFKNLPDIRFGYTVGIGFPPVWSQQRGINIVRGSSVVLQPGMVFHFVTFILREDRYGIGQSCSVTITQNGHENLTPGLEPGPLFLE